MLSPRVVLLAISRQKLMREARWGMTIPTSHSTSSSNSSIASQALSCEERGCGMSIQVSFPWKICLGIRLWYSLHSYVVFRTDLHTNTKVHRCVRVITIATDREMYCEPKGYIYLIVSNKGSNHCHYFWDHRLKQRLCEERKSSVCNRGTSFYTTDECKLNFLPFHRLPCIPP